MKHLFSLSLLLLSSVFSYGQDNWQINFEDSSTLDRVLIDTISNPNNAWQIGHPNKSIFTNANSEPYVIVTDSTNPYSVNDTSSFTIIHIASYAWNYGYPNITIGGYYNVNSDSLSDYGIIDYSLDHGDTWYSIDSTDVSCYWSYPPVLPVLTGNSNGWKFFNYCLSTSMTVDLGDTVLYRFTFISDSIQTNKDGLMFDDLHFEDWVEGIEERNFQNLSSKAYPNPVSSSLTIEFDNARNQLFQLNIFDALGRVIYSKSATDQRISVPTDGLDSGIYHYTLTNNELNRRASGRFVVQKE